MSKEFDLIEKVVDGQHISPVLPADVKNYLIDIERDKYKEEIKIANQKGYEKPLFYLSIQKNKDSNFYVSKKITSRNYWHDNVIHKNSKKDILKRYQIFLKN